MTPFTPPALDGYFDPISGALWLTFVEEVPLLLRQALLDEVFSYYLRQEMPRANLQGCKAAAKGWLQAEVCRGRLWRDCFGRWRYLLGRPATQRTI